MILFPLLGALFAGLFGRKIGVTGCYIINCLCLFISCIIVIMGFLVIFVNNCTIYVTLAD
jgi:hypothetical protein